MLKEVAKLVRIVHPLLLARKDDEPAHFLEGALIGSRNKPLSFQNGIVRRKVSGARAAAKRADSQGQRFSHIVQTLCRRLPERIPRPAVSGAGGRALSS
jgi:hypothetical protein